MRKTHTQLFFLVCFELGRGARTPYWSPEALPTDRRIIKPHRYISNELCLPQNRLYIYEYIFVYDLSLAAMFVYHFGKCALCAGGGLSPFRTTGAEREALADVEEKTDFHLNKST